MPTVRCPSCNRALNLPEHADIRTARCPLCQTTFDVADRAPPPPPVPRGPAPGAPEVDTASAGESAPFDFNEAVPHPLAGDDRRALASAGSWLQAAGMVGLAHSLFCWCGSVIPLEGTEGLVAGCCFGYVLQIVASALVYRGGRELTTQQSIGFARTAVAMAFLAVVLELLFAIPLVLFTLERGRVDSDDVALLVLVAGLRVVLIALFLTAGARAMLALRRPGVRRAFSR